MPNSTEQPSPSPNEPQSGSISRHRAGPALAWRRCRRQALVLIAALSLSGGVFAVTWHNPARAYQPSDLPKIEMSVREEFAGVAQLPPGDFNALKAGADPLVVDVREPGEYAVSHIDGAVRVDPNISADAFVDKFAASVAGRTAVFYCSVGVRSSRLAARVGAALQARGASRVYNLEGGLFRWHNERRDLVDTAGPTDRIHPYDTHWGGLIARQDRIATKPR